MELAGGIRRIILFSLILCVLSHEASHPLAAFSFQPPYISRNFIL